MEVRTAIEEFYDLRDLVRGFKRVLDFKSYPSLTQKPPLRKENACVPSL